MSCLPVEMKMANAVPLEIFSEQMDSFIYTPFIEFQIGSFCYVESVPELKLFACKL